MIPRKKPKTDATASKNFLFGFTGTVGVIAGSTKVSLPITPASEIFVSSSFSSRRL